THVQEGRKITWGFCYVSRVKKKKKKEVHETPGVPSSKINRTGKRTDVWPLAIYEESESDEVGGAMYEEYFDDLDDHGNRPRVQQVEEAYQDRTAKAIYIHIIEIIPAFSLHLS
ncbi:MAG: hypothetical protein LQ349_004474, partial [Xanthoria aureola]